MSSLDIGYVTELVELARGGDNTAFAELYAATYQKQYLFACLFLKNEDTARDVLQDTYIYAFRNLSLLRDPAMVISWLNRVNLSICIKASSDGTSDPEAKEVEIGRSSYTIRRIMALPPAESQALLMYYMCDMKLRDIASFMEVKPAEVRRRLRSGSERLEHVLPERSSK